MITHRTSREGPWDISNDYYTLNFIVLHGFIFCDIANAALLLKIIPLLDWVWTYSAGLTYIHVNSPKYISMEWCPT